MSYSLQPTPPPDRSVKIPHLVFGLLFLGLAAIWALGASGVLRAEELTILGPAVLVAAGVVGLIASLAGARRRHSREPVQQARLDTHSDPETQTDTEEIR